MTLLKLNKSISIIVTTFSSVAVSNLIFANSAHAFTVNFDNGGFEQSIGGGTQNNWNTIGDVSNQGDININGTNTINPTRGTNQAVITTGYVPGVYDSIDRNDDNNLNFNRSGSQPVSADTNPIADLLQEHFGFNADAFSIDRTGASIPNLGPRTSKEGSGMYQDFDVTLGAGETSFSIAFDWAFVSNDGTTSGGDQDFAFWSLGEIDSSGNNYSTVFDGSEDGIDDVFDTNEIAVLRSSSDAISSPSEPDSYVYDYDYPGANNPDSTNNDNERYTYTVDGLTPGTYRYRVGFGVVDVDGLERTSTLLVDNVEVIPFEFSPTAGLGLVAAIFGFSRMRRKLQDDDPSQNTQSQN